MQEQGLQTHWRVVHQMGMGSIAPATRNQTRRSLMLPQNQKFVLEASELTCCCYHLPVLKVARSPLNFAQMDLLLPSLMVGQMLALKLLQQTLGWDLEEQRQCQKQKGRAGISLQDSETFVLLCHYISPRLYQSRLLCSDSSLGKTAVKGRVQFFR